MAKWIPSTDELQQIEDWIAKGMTEGSIHRKLGVGASTWYDRKREMSTIGDAVHRGKTRDEEVCMNRLRQIAFDDKARGNLTALIFYGKINHGWNDGTRVDNKPKPSSFKAKEIKSGNIT